MLELTENKTDSRDILDDKGIGILGQTVDIITNRDTEVNLGDILNDKLIGNLPRVIDTIANRSTEIISQVKYGEDEGALQQLIGRVSTMSYTHRNKVEKAYKMWQEFKKDNKIHDLQMSQAKELALATYIFTYNDEAKGSKIEGILEEVESLGINVKKIHSLIIGTKRFAKNVTFGSNETKTLDLITGLAVKNRMPSITSPEEQGNPLDPAHKL